MHQPSFASPARLLAAFMAVVCLAVGAEAQNPPASPAAPVHPATSPSLSGPGPSSPGPSSSGSASKTDPDGAFLARAGQLYYSTAKAGLKGFDCSVHPDWRASILSTAPGSAVANDDPRILLLKTVGITLHGRLTGGSSLDWNLPPALQKPLDQDSIDLLDHMHQASDRTLTGFMQFWSPFVDGSVIPASSEGIEISHTEKGHTLHADQGGTSLTEVLDNNLVMQQFNVVMGGAKIDFSPRYKPTGQGLLVNGFEAHIQGPSVPPEQAEQMHVDVDYQTVSGFPIPSRISMEVVGTETFKFTLDGCTANPPSS